MKALFARHDIANTMPLEGHLGTLTQGSRSGLNYFRPYGVGVCERRSVPTLFFLELLWPRMMEINTNWYPEGKPMSTRGTIAESRVRRNARQQF